MDLWMIDINNTLTQVCPKRCTDITVPTEVAIGEQNETLIYQQQWVMSPDPKVRRLSYIKMVLFY